MPERTASKPKWNLLPELQRSRYETTLKAFPEAQRFLVEFNLESCTKLYDSAKTPLAALRTKKLNLREIGEIYNQEIPKLLIEGWLITLGDIMDFDVSSLQARQTAQFVFEETKMLNLAELTLLFKRIQTGFYGPFYGKFNPQIICIDCREYRKERGAIISRLTTEEQEDILKTVFIK